ncbi:two-component system sensor histidine kinase CreC [Undibacterium cyanobacteriorum]|uniref:histidine kinase n=1 Tax=Undibacterium cyanobacteriorum TaxID=3073561 RepID=A0ABY9RJ89_9BURK|nr:two-component system sensor histidine kinase CreC [Undibacterium sp. 20NA77.5]WMW80730.1 two-component system sensor histidine kinase CreC [Undibacterium sp. 20NA77.5]
MRIGLRILLGYFLILGLAAWFVLNVFVMEVRPGVRATLEDTLIDTAQLLARLVAEDVKQGDLAHAPLLKRLENYAQRSIDVKLSGVQKVKSQLDYRIYITDAQGIVIFDSDNKDLGKDYSRWNDVYLTLRGQYGARSTRANPDDEDSTVMHVAAPIMDNNNDGKPRRLLGVLTVAKPISTIKPFIERSQKKILQRSFWALLVSLLIGIGFSWWLSRSLKRLQDYAKAVSVDAKTSLPKLGNNEIGELGLALESMRAKLEGKEYVETLMHTLTHELKSPIAAIQGSAELLKEDMPEAERQRFLSNIIEQNQRQRNLIDRLLQLVRLEKQQRLEQVEPIDLAQLLKEVLEDCQVALDRKHIQTHLVLPESNVQLAGDHLLLRQALGNLFDNAIAFSPPQSSITVSAVREEQQLCLRIDDQGTGIPDYALDKLFERFYSLPRPDSDKSTGLGLPFVKEVASLHGGSVHLMNRANDGVDLLGVRAEMRLPLPH